MSANIVAVFMMQMDKIW